jgi:hypothetical protein
MTLIPRQPSPLADALGYDPGFGAEFQSGASGAYPPPLLQNIQDMGSLNGTMLKQAEEGDLPQPSFTRKGDGTWQISGLTDNDMGAIKKQNETLASILGSMQVESDRLKAREDAARANPIMNALTNIAAGLAQNDPTLPGWVRALGATSARLNPTPDALAHQRFGVMDAMAGVTEKSAGLALQSGQLRAQGQRIAIDAAEAKQKKLKDFRDAMSRTMGPYLERSLNGEMVSSDQLADTFERQGLGTRKEAVQAATALNEQAMDAKAKKEEMRRVLSTEDFAKFEAQEKVKSKNRVRELHEEYKLKEKMEGVKQEDRLEAIEKRAKSNTAYLAQRLAIQQEWKTKGNITKALQPTTDDVDMFKRLGALDLQLDRLEQALEANGSYYGPLSGTVLKAQKWVDPKARAAYMDSRRAILAIIKSDGEKLGRMTDFDFREILKSLATETATPESMRKMFRDVRDAGDDKRKIVAHVSYLPEFWKAQSPDILGPRLRDVVLGVQHGVLPDIGGGSLPAPGTEAPADTVDASPTKTSTHTVFRPGYGWVRP